MCNDMTYNCFNHIKEPIAVSKENGEVVYLNDAFIETFIEVKEKSNKNISELINKINKKFFEKIKSVVLNKNEFLEIIEIGTKNNRKQKFKLTVTYINDKFFFVFYAYNLLSVNDSITDLITKITSTFDLDDILERGISALSNIFNFSGYNICIPDDEKNVLRVLKVSIPDFAKDSFKFLRNTKFPFDETGGLIAKSLLNNEVIYIPDVNDISDPAISDEITRDLMKKMNITGQIIFPMIMETIPVGVITFYCLNEEKLCLSNDDIYEIKRLIIPITIAINNAILHNKVLRQTVELEQIIAKRTDETRKKSEILEILNTITKKINASLDLDEVLDVMAGELRKLFYFEGFAVLLVDDNKENLITLKLVIPNADKDFLDYVQNRKIPLNLLEGGGVAVAVLQNRDMYFEDIDPSKLPNDVNREAVIKSGGLKSLLIMPLTVNSEVVGALMLSAYSRNLGFTEEDIGTIRRFVEQISSAIKNSFLHKDLQRALNDLEKANQKLKQQKKLLKELSITDSLTGIRNRRYFDERIMDEFEKCKRYKKTMYIMMLDIDNFKSVNDNYGHDYGDYVLIKLTELLQENLRKVDLFARYGGEEFIIAMFEIDTEGAKLVAEKIRKKVEDTVFKYKNIEIQRTLSIGISCYPSKAEEQKNIHFVIKEADEALYIAKNTGKNKWVYYYEVDDR